MRPPFPSQGTPNLNSLLIIGLLLLVIAAGCREQAPPQAVAWDAVPGTLTAAFQSAPPAVRDQVQATVSALQSNDLAVASVGLQALCAQPELTDSQRAGATRCWLAVQDRLRAAAAAGDATAGEVIQLQRGAK